MGLFECEVTHTFLMSHFSKDFTYLKRIWMAKIFFRLSVVSSYESSGS